MLNESGPRGLVLFWISYPLAIIREFYVKLAMFHLICAGGEFVYSNHLKL